MEEAKTKNPKKEVSLIATVVFTLGGCGLGKLIAPLCNFFLDFTGKQADVLESTCVLVLGIIGFVAGVWFDQHYDVKAPSM